MEAVISGQAGVALLVDGDTMSSIHVHDPHTVVTRRAGEFHYLFGAASDLLFVEDVSPDDVRQELQTASDGEDVTQLTLLLLAPDRSEEVRQLAAEELSDLLTANSQAAAFAERLLLSTALPQDADMAGALRLCSDGPARDFLIRLERLQPSVRLTQEAWNAIPEDFFGDSAEDCRAAADAIFVREGVVRQFVLAAAGELAVQEAIFSALQIPAVRSFPNHPNIVIQWKSNRSDYQETDKRSTENDLPVDQSAQQQQAHADVRAAFERLQQGECRAVRLLHQSDTPCKAIFAGAFNPLHDGHRRMVTLAEELLGTPVEFEISIQNADKPPLQLQEVQRRVERFESYRAIWLRAPTFVEKAEIFPGATFIVGAETIARIAAPRYYRDDLVALQRAVEAIANARCHFLVFGRLWPDGFKTIEEIEFGAKLRALCRQVPEDRFRLDSSYVFLTNG